MFGNTNPGMLLPPQVIERYTTTTATDHVLSSTGVRAGQVFWIINRTTNNTVLTIKSSDGDSIETIRYGRCVLMALQDNPTDATHWDVVEVYEEGNWTPTVIMGTTQGSAAVSSVNHAFFSRRNSTVSVNAGFTFEKGTGTGTVVWGGLPYTVNAGGFNQSPHLMFVRYVGVLSLTAGYIPVQLFLGGTTRIETYQFKGDSGTSAALVDTNFAASVIIHISGWYRKN